MGLTVPKICRVELDTMLLHRSELVEGESCVRKGKEEIRLQLETFDATIRPSSASSKRKNKVRYLKLTSSINDETPLSEVDSISLRDFQSDNEEDEEDQEVAVFEHRTDSRNFEAVGTSNREWEKTSENIVHTSRV